MFTVQEKDKSTVCQLNTLTYSAFLFIIHSIYRLIEKDCCKRGNKLLSLHQRKENKIINHKNE